MAQMCVSAVTQGELFYGLARKPEATGLRTAVHGFLSRLDVLPWDSAAAERYGALRASPEPHGTPLGNHDTLIAAHAPSVDAANMPNDTAFAWTRECHVNNWKRPLPRIRRSRPR